MVCFATPARVAFSVRKTNAAFASAPPPARSGPWRLLPDPQVTNSPFGQRQPGKAGWCSLGLPHALRIPCPQSHAPFSSQKKSPTRCQRRQRREQQCSCFRSFFGHSSIGGLACVQRPARSGDRVRSSGPRRLALFQSAAKAIMGGLSYIMTGRREKAQFLIHVKQFSNPWPIALFAADHHPQRQGPHVRRA